MILISGSSEREIVDLQKGDYEEMDQLAIAKPLCKAAYRILHAEDIGIGIARAIRAAVSGRPGGVYLDLPAKLLGQTMDAVAGITTGISSLIGLVAIFLAVNPLAVFTDAFPPLEELTIQRVRFPAAGQIEHRLALVEDRR